jgi:4-amino-4-deoxychorismate lyase
MFPLFESIRFEKGRFLNLQGHRRRMEYSYYRYYGMHKTFPLEKLLAILPGCKDVRSIYKVRLLYNLHDYRQECELYRPRNLRSFRLVEANHLNYSLKYTDREQLNNLREQSGTDEVIIVRKGLITDTSFSNLAFFDGEHWFTPARPLLYGTAREKLLHDGIIRERDLYVEDLKSYKHFSLINAMLPFGQQEYDISLIESY